jgi:FkbM family methyltransferase
MKLISRQRFVQSAIIPGRPFTTAARWLAWLLYCVTRLRAVVRFEHVDARMRLLPRLTNFGSTSIFIKRDHYEPELLALRPFIEPGSVVVDVGGSFGIYSLFLSRYVGPAGRVITFEPGALSYRLLTENLALNGAANVSAHKNAVADRPGTMRLYHIGGSPVNFSLGRTEGIESETVEAVSLDEFLSPHQRTRVSFMKMDVEGYEFFVLAGAKQLIKEAKPVIMFEVSYGAMRRAGVASKAAFDFLESFGYEFFTLRGPQFLPLLQPSEGNIFAVHRDRQKNFTALPVVAGLRAVV